jgi:hypothetical protein
VGQVAQVDRVDQAVQEDGVVPVHQVAVEALNVEDQAVQEGGVVLAQVVQMGVDQAHQAAGKQLNSIFCQF